MCVRFFHPKISIMFTFYGFVSVWFAFIIIFSVDFIIHLIVFKKIFILTAVFITFNVELIMMQLNGWVYVVRDIWFCDRFFFVFFCCRIDQSSVCMLSLFINANLIAWRYSLQSKVLWPRNLCASLFFVALNWFYFKKSRIKKKLNNKK